jgi:hypothetical protein
MKGSSVICATVGALALAGIATTMPAEARGGFGPGLAGAAVGGAIVAGAASSAYAYGPGPAYAYDSYDYDGGPGYYGAPYGGRYSRNTYGSYDESQHGGQPSYSRPY